MARAGGSKSYSNMLPLPPEGPLPSLNTVLKTTPENPSGDPHGGAHQAGEAAGKVIGGGLGVVIGAVLLLMFGPDAVGAAVGGPAAARGSRPWRTTAG
jgi:hypothetical protein